MESNVITVIGTLGGIGITQLFNYIMENKRFINQANLKKLELDSTNVKHLHDERRRIYSDYLKKIDDLLAEPPRLNSLDTIMNDYYSAVILSDDDTNEHIRFVFNMARDHVNKAHQYSDNELKNAKGELLISMRRQLEK